MDAPCVRTVGGGRDGARGAVAHCRGKSSINASRLAVCAIRGADRSRIGHCGVVAPDTEARAACAACGCDGAGIGHIRRNGHNAIGGALARRLDNTGIGDRSGAAEDGECVHAIAGPSAGDYSHVAVIAHGYVARASGPIGVDAGGGQRAVVRHQSCIGQDAIGFASAGGRGDGACGGVVHRRNAARIDAIGVTPTRGLRRHGAGSRIGQRRVRVERVDACGGA